MEPTLLLDVEFVLKHLIYAKHVVSLRLFTDTQQNSIDYVSYIAKIAYYHMTGLAKYIYDKYVHSIDDDTHRQTATEMICCELIGNASCIDLTVSSGFDHICPCDGNLNRSHIMLHFAIYCIDKLGFDVNTNHKAFIASGISGCELFRDLVLTTTGTEGGPNFIIRTRGSAISSSSDNRNT
jgi:hypothetical protein